MSYATKAAAEGGGALTRVLIGGAIASLATMSLAFSTIAFTSYRSAMEQRDEILSELAVSRAAEEAAAKNSSTAAAEWVTALQQSSSNKTGGYGAKAARTQDPAARDGGEEPPEDSAPAAAEKPEGESTEDGGESGQEEQAEKSGQGASSDGTKEESGEASPETGEEKTEGAESSQDAGETGSAGSGGNAAEPRGAEAESELAPPNGGTESNPSAQAGLAGIPSSPSAGQYSTNNAGSPASDSGQGSPAASAQTPAQLNPDAQRSAPAGGSAPAQVSDASRPDASAQQGAPAQQGGSVQQSVPVQPSSPAQPEMPGEEAYPGQNSGSSSDVIEPFQEYGSPKKEAVENGNGGASEETAGASASGEIGPGIGMSQVDEKELDSIASEGMQQHYADTASESASAESGSADPFANYYAPTVFNDYNVLLDTAMGPMLYYNQHDSHWASYKYGGTDPMTSYGCGPTATAMVVNAFGNIQGAITPKEMADWSSSYGYFAPQNGSYHNYIPAVLSAFDLLVDTVQDRSVEHVSQLLRDGHILVALMGQGALTKGGHFIVITRLNEDGTVNIADPNSYKNSTKKWELSQILNELKGAYDGGGPLWSVQRSL